MPLKKSGELTTAELRKLIAQHNRLVKVTIPKGTKREGLIKIIKDNGYSIDHKKQRLVPIRVQQNKKYPPVVDLPPPKKKEEKKEEPKKESKKVSTPILAIEDIKKQTAPKKEKKNYSVDQAKRKKANKETQDLYGKPTHKILGVSARASPSEIKKAFRSFLKFHPDKPDGDKEKFQMYATAFKGMMDSIDIKEEKKPEVFKDTIPSPPPKKKLTEEEIKKKEEEIKKMKEKQKKPEKQIGKLAGKKVKKVKKN